LGSNARLEAPANIDGAGALVAQGYSIDSRSIGAGELFFAVRGERLDGHDYIVAALQRGAIAAVVSAGKAASLPDEVLAAPLLMVEDPLLHCRPGGACAQAMGRRVVAVTGSAGKTSTKDAVAAALGAQLSRI
jgi:UDP-N-acetylmuramoyl-tripeptide--D-alanyl-D-alanine ligase